MKSFLNSLRLLIQRIDFTGPAHSNSCEVAWHRRRGLRYASVSSRSGLNDNAEQSPTIMETSSPHPLTPAFPLFLLLLLACAPWAKAATNIALPFYEPFAYT